MSRMHGPALVDGNENVFSLERADTKQEHDDRISAAFYPQERKKDQNCGNRSESGCAS